MHQNVRFSIDLAQKPFRSETSHFRSDLKKNDTLRASYSQPMSLGRLLENKVAKFQSNIEQKYCSTPFLLVEKVVNFLKETKMCEKFSSEC